jgi:hypothetical protein
MSKEKTLIILMFTALVLISMNDLLKDAEVTYPLMGFNKLNETPEEVLYNIDAISISYNVLQVKGIERSFFNNNDTYSLINKSGRKYFFRYVNLHTEGNSIRLTDVYWLNTIPYTGTEFKVIYKERFEKIQKGEFTVSFIGDHSSYVYGGAYLRQFWSELNPDIKFVGNSKDKYGYPYGLISDIDFERIEKVGLVVVYLTEKNFELKTALVDSILANCINVVVVSTGCLHGELGLENVVCLESLLENTDYYLETDIVNKNGAQKVVRSLNKYVRN